MTVLVICLALFSLIFPVPAASDPVWAELEFDTPPEGAWTVGDHIPLHLSITHSPGFDVSIPRLPQVWGSFEVLDQTTAEAIENDDGTFTLTGTVIVTLWSPGDFETPPLIIHYRDHEGERYESSAPSQSITVTSVLEPGDMEKRDLKPQAALPQAPLWPWVLSGLLVVLLAGIAAWFLWTRLRRRRALAPALASVQDPRPPHEIAYSELDRISELALPVRGEMKRHYTLVSDCLRGYVQGRYDIPAMDQTTEELLTVFRRARIDRGHASLFGELLTEADLVKFAKFIPLNDQAQSAIAQARHIVDVTKIEPEQKNSSDTLHASRDP